MARRRLTQGPAADVPHPEVSHPGVPRAERGLETKGFPGSRIAPIAREASDAAGAAALQELAETLRRARDEGRMVLDLPLDAIAPDHLARDRVPRDDEEMAALRESLRAHGQRTPIEVTPLGGASGGASGGALPYGLISGWRRLSALRALHAETGEPRFSTVQALVRTPASAQDAYVAMVEENEIRLGLSHYERARVAARAAARGVFPSEDAALRALFATASRPKRSRIRAFLAIYHALDGSLRFPAHLPERLGLKLVEMVRAGEAELIAHALARDDPQTPEAERATLARLTAPEPSKHRARAPARLLPEVTLEQRLRGRTLTLKLKGKGVTPALAAEVERLLRRLGSRD
jgi:hypothetical protein